MKLNRTQIETIKARVEKAKLWAKLMDRGMTKTWIQQNYGGNIKTINDYCSTLKAIGEEGLFKELESREIKRIENIRRTKSITKKQKEYFDLTEDPVNAVIYAKRPSILFSVNELLT